MKGIAHISLIFCVLVTITKGWILPLSVGHQTFSPKKIVSVSRVTRQVNDAECSSVVSKGVCSPSFAQKFINALSQCGSLGSDEAITYEKGCRQSSAGAYCSSVNIALITSVCRSNAGCSAACGKSLTDLGCCLNPDMDILEQNFTACGLAFPSACPPSSLTIPTYSDSHSCSSKKDFSRFETDYICSNGRPVLDDLISNNCPKYARAIQDECRYRDGKNCVEVIEASTIQENATLEKAIMNCPSKSSCSSACRSTLNGFKDSLGCCLNLFNASLEDSSNDVSTYSVIRDNALWQECGITPPGVCESPLNAAASSAYSTAGNIAFLVLAATLFNFA